MRKNLLSLTSLSLIALLVFAVGCSDDSDSPTNFCASVNNFTVTQSGELLNFDITSSSAGLYYEVSAVSTENSSTGPGSGTILALATANETLSLNENYFTGDYVFYVRAVCTDNSRSEWYGPKPLSISDYCNTPDNLQVSYFGFTWNYTSPFVAASTYQVQYGPQGFTLGNGTMATVNEESYNGFSTAAGQSYDFYVRAFCVNNVGYGSWAGPFNYFSEGNHHMCLAPANIAYVIDGSNGSNRTVHFTYEWNGEEKFEHIIVKKDHAISEGGEPSVIYTGSWPAYNISTYFDWDFYIRAVCQDGSKTQWVKKTVDFNN